MTKRSRHGFTIIELLVAMTILMLLVTVAGVSFSSGLDASRNAKRRADLEMVRAALEMFRTQRASKAYPTFSSGDDANNFNYLVASVLYPTYLSTSSVKDPLDGQTGFKYYYSGTASQYQVCAYIEGSTLPAGCQSVNTSLITTTVPTGTTTLCCLNQP